MANRAWAVAIAAALSWGLVTAPVQAQDYVGRTPPTVPVEPKVLGQVETRAGGTGATDPIPITGGDVAGLTAIGMAAVATGAVLLRRGRRAPG